ncbi:MAG: hypothetical protein ACD_30C00090G0019 [uncultured bacterium]|uniref:Phospholipase C/D domain-containing protein n=3 Tax=Candidatus Daviesiibacteriota TaxID=1752718 RepID=A0A0G0HVR5_9BACT|nr:MAG: hypothetical protein ACD_30C00090G0019 [uncultured bacterium]KKQ07986.1 MAG: hypothetical protein US19_C0034G0022 [Candidatus Daviesbacteria bacterium GW2011_GWB1_36_5]KKQ16170.1 MAG: hypothetical protein US28_C0004G0012 [Candidatus Daviesbacteria bacterium GW2011_GWA1_36_8]OGE33246.1 MAG: hypothetical protein A3C99_01365 [Candidatus Daviesbacteria bacterium RIFCSPHIGHO2_02_FULL_37_9]OGE36148.1 MAG: hypothetical protein A3E66_05055 [Candidatus Daviesbacteria bacterium RIFCSPHIGHO2_12_FU
MFYNTHAYLASKLYRSGEALLLIGSILPDIAITKIITWDKGLHGKENFESFFKLIEKKYPEYEFLKKGILAHNIIDDFTHKDYPGGTGYAFQNNKELIKLLIEYYEITRKRAKVLAHNYIESAVDIYLLKDHPEIQDKIKSATGKTNKEKLAEILGDYFKNDANNFSKALNNFFGLIKKYDFKKEENWVIFWEDFAKLLDLKDVGKEKRVILMDKALEVVKNTYKVFLNYSLKEGLKKNL